MCGKETEVYPLAEVRGHEVNDCCGKLLFTLVESRCGISILLKRKGESETYCIPLFLLLEPFAVDLEELKRCTRLTAYTDHIGMCRK